MVCQECNIEGHTASVCITNYRNLIAKNKSKSVTCPICLECNTKKLCETICGHAFHVKCIKEWLKDHSDCPLCREVLVDKETVLDVLIDNILIATSLSESLSQVELELRLQLQI